MGNPLSRRLQASVSPASLALLGCVIAVPRYPHGNRLAPGRGRRLRSRSKGRQPVAFDTGRRLNPLTGRALRPEKVGMLNEERILRSRHAAGSKRRIARRTSATTFDPGSAFWREIHSAILRREAEPLT